MGRTRDAALTGAIAAVTKYGSRKATMGDIAMLAGIAKATLYNHFRTRAEVYSAVVAAEVDAIAQAATAAAGGAVATDDGGAPAVALAEAARLIGEHPAVRRIAAEEPAVLAVLAAVGSGPAWSAARSHIVTVFDTPGTGVSAAGVDLALRYLASQLLAPSTAEERTAAAAALAIAVQSSAVQSSAVQNSAVQSSAVQSSAVQSSAVQSSAVQSSAVQNSAVQDTAVET